MDSEYVVGDETVRLPVDTRSIAVRFREPARMSMRAAFMADRGIRPFRERLELPREKFTIFSTPPEWSTDPEGFQDEVDRLKSEPEIMRIAFVHRLRDNLVVATDRIMMGFHPQVRNPADLLHSRGFEILDHWGSEYVVRLGERDDPFAVSSELRERREVSYAEPDFVVIFHPGTRAALPGLPPGTVAEVLERQSDMHRIKAFEAQKDFGLGSPDVLIAILDLGVEDDHDDLVNVVVAGYDALRNDPCQEPLAHEFHGTACAGLAAAEANAVGIRGVAAGCGVLAVRVATRDLENGGWIMVDHEVARGIDWARTRGADVMSLSWFTTPESTGIIAAIERARLKGRDCKGCVVVAAAGNRLEENPPEGVDFPANLPGVLAVAASTNAEGPKRFSATERWESAFGKEVAIAAPGVRNFTTDLSRGRGENTNPSRSGDYVLVNGTSFSTALVAGAAAMVLSVRPDLTEAQVRDALCTGVDKVPDPAEYTPAGPAGRNNRMGFGRLNVLKALKAAKAMP
jgi:thermitase